MMDYTRRQTNPNLALYPLILQVAAVFRYTRHLLLENGHLTAPQRYINQLAINNLVSPSKSRGRLLISHFNLHG